MKMNQMQERKKESKKIYFEIQTVWLNPFILKSLAETKNSLMVMFQVSNATCPLGKNEV